MVVCDFCKKKVIGNETYILPMYEGYCKELNGIVLETFDRLEDRTVTLCLTCKHRLAKVLKHMEE